LEEKSRELSARERSRRLYGFSWTTSVKVARGFAEHWQTAGNNAVVLETVASPEAILLVRRDKKHFNEREVVIDPFSLGIVTVALKLDARS
jgi:hypothetical protein